MKLRLFHRNKPALAPGIQAPAVRDTLSRVSVACIELTPEGELTDINMQAFKALRLGGGDFPHPLRISDLFSVCHDKKDLLPAIFKGLERHKTYGDLPPWSYIQLSGRDNLKFYIEGRFVGHYDRHRKLRRIVFLFRDIEEEVCRRFILDMAMAQTKIFPWFFDLDNGRMVIDARWFDHVGIPRGDCSMSPGIFFDMLHPDDRETLSAAFAKQLSGILTPEAYAYRVRRCDGTWEWFEGQSVYLGQAHDGSPYRVVGICQSIQPHKEIEGHLREARDKARENDRLKSAFLANMSHEIRTPLNAIVGFAKLIGEVETEEEKQQFIDIIDVNSELLLQLINDILDISKIEAGTLEFRFRPMNLNDLCRSELEVHKPRVKPGVELVFEERVANVEIVCDQNRLAQVISNLLNNAGKFTEEGEIRFGFDLKDGCVEFFVQDTGMGIPPEKARNIFDRFVKLNDFVSGTGLGLAISKMIVEKLDGTIGVDSEPGKGTRFHFSIPVVHRDGSKNDEQLCAAPGRDDGKSWVLLVAEDSDTNFRLIEAVLSRRFSLVRAHTGAEAVDMFGTVQPDAVLMDIRMPVMDGLEATRRIRSVSADVPIIAMSAYSSGSEIESARNAGCNEFLVKPLSQYSLHRALNAALVEFKGKGKS